MENDTLKKPNQNDSQKLKTHRSRKNGQWKELSLN